LAIGSFLPGKSIIGVSEYGDGRIVYICYNMFGDDRPYEENYEMISNALKWLTESVNQIQ